YNLFGCLELGLLKCPGGNKSTFAIPRNSCEAFDNQLAAEPADAPRASQIVVAINHVKNQNVRLQKFGHHCDGALADWTALRMGLAAAQQGARLGRGAQRSTNCYSREGVVAACSRRAGRYAGQTTVTPKLPRCRDPVEQTYIRVHPGARSVL
uniref:Uncharacterized protein n=1 Tax=Anopheles atroparvus TaxID=41427 RepID=A0AAG5DU66_ANOAO